MKKNNHPDNQDGFVLVAALLILLVLTLMGISVNRSTNTEWRIAMNDRLQKETFYLADATTELIAEVLVQNIACLGFTPIVPYAVDDRGMLGMMLPGTAARENVGNGIFKSQDVYIEPEALGLWRFYSPEGVALPTDGMDDDSDGIGDGWDCDTDDDGIGDAVDIDYICDADNGETRTRARDMVFPAYYDSNGEYNQTETNKRPHANIKIGGNTQIQLGAALQMAAGYEGLGKSLASGGTRLVYDINVRQQGKNGGESVISVKYAHILGTAGTCNYKED